MIETLTCEHDGHTWPREIARGQKPRFCPEHRPAKPVAAAPAAPRSLASDRALEILTSDQNLDREFERKLTYVVEQLDDPCIVKTRDGGDINLLSSVQKDLLRQYDRKKRAA